MNAPIEYRKSTVSNSSARATPEGRFVAPPRLVSQHWEDAFQGAQSVWTVASPASNPTHELETLRSAWRELISILANRYVLEAPEIFEMPPAPTRRVIGLVRKVGPAPFVFVDDFADQSQQDK